MHCVDTMDFANADFEATLFWVPKNNSLYAYIPAEWVGRDIVYTFNGAEKHQQGHWLEGKPVILIDDQHSGQHHGNKIMIRLNPLPI